MSFKPYTEKIKKKKIEICSILGRIRIHHPGSGSADPHQNDTDPKHCFLQLSLREPTLCIVQIHQNIYLF